MNPPLTSVREFPEELGKHLAKFVLRRLQEPDGKPQQLTIPTLVVERDSTRPRATRSSRAPRSRVEIAEVPKV
jgi:DNA-binding LacI/PurR family transcriptional regulator